MKLTDLVPWRTHEELSRSSTVDPLTSFRREVNRLFDDFFVAQGTHGFVDGNEAFTPAVDISETDASININVELPGMAEKDVELVLDDDVLTIRGEKKDESERSEEGVRLRERSYGRFERVVRLSSEIEPDKVHATYEQGVLSISLPKTEKAKKARRKIPVDS